MKELKNNTLRNLTYEEHGAILEACQTLEKGFKKKVFAAYINADQKNKDDVFGLAFSFDQFEHTRG